MAGNSRSNRLVEENVWKIPEAWAGVLMDSKDFLQNVVCEN